MGAAVWWLCSKLPTFKCIWIESGNMPQLFCQSLTNSGPVSESQSETRADALCWSRGASDLSDDKSHLFIFEYECLFLPLPLHLGAPPEAGTSKMFVGCWATSNNPLVPQLNLVADDFFFWCRLIAVFTFLLPQMRIIAINVHQFGQSKALWIIFSYFLEKDSEQLFF